MAGFQTHITVSTTLGIGYGALGYYLGMPAESCALAAGLCSLSGMLPDLDSDSGVPVRETMSLTSAVVPMLLAERLREMNWSHETMVLCMASAYLVMRFGIGSLFQKFTVHRGMWHSIPACLIAGLLAFLIVSGANLDIRIFKALGVVIGFMSHLVLDEIWSFSLSGGRLKVKKSLGTALKFWGKVPWVNTMTYIGLFFVTFIAIGDPVLMTRMGFEMKVGDQTAQQWIEQRLETAGAKRINPQQPETPNWR